MNNATCVPGRNAAHTVHELGDEHEIQQFAAMHGIQVGSLEALLHAIVFCICTVRVRPHLVDSCDNCGYLGSCG